mgnify:CR=1 FL=1
MTIFVHQDEFQEKEQKVIAGIHRAVAPDFLELESDLALIAVVGRGMKATPRLLAGRLYDERPLALRRIRITDINRDPFWKEAGGRRAGGDPWLLWLRPRREDRDLFKRRV